jgi:hypothetical protein
MPSKEIRCLDKFARVIPSSSPSWLKFMPSHAGGFPESERRLDVFGAAAGLAGARAEMHVHIVPRRNGLNHFRFSHPRQSINDLSTFINSFRSASIALTTCTTPAGKRVPMPWIKRVSFCRS